MKKKDADSLKELKKKMQINWMIDKAKRIDWRN